LLSLTRTLLTPVVLALTLAVIVAVVLVVLLHGTGRGRSGAAPHGSADGSRTPSARSVSPNPSAPIRWSTVVPRLDCAGVGTVVDARAIGDLNGDGRNDAVIGVHCDAGAGSPPSVVDVFLDEAGSPQLLGEVVSTDDDLLVKGVSLHERILTVRALGYSPGTPRCCPDKTVVRSWRVTGVAGASRLVPVH
jgi:hypothetical protein